MNFDRESKQKITRDKKYIVDESLRLLTIEDVSKILCISKRTVYNYIKEGKLPFIKLSNRALRFKESDLIKLISERTVRYEPNKKTDLIAEKVLEKIRKRG